MQAFTIDQIREIMNNQEFIRNMSVIAHVDHGKSTLTDSLVAKGGFMSKDKAGSARYTDTRKDEQEKGITIKSTGISLFYDYSKNEEEKAEKYLINLIDSPGHVDFSSEVTAALRVTDGALVVVDYVEGVSVQTETVLKQALMELIQPILMINKVDRAFFELKQNSEDIYQQFQRVIESFNVIVSTYQKPDLDKDCQVDPVKGNVAMGSAYYGFGFSVYSFAKIYSKKFGTNISKLLDVLWGDNYYNGKKFTKEPAEDSTRSFCGLVIDPVMKLAQTLHSGKKEAIVEILNRYKINIDSKDYELESKLLIRKVFQNWIDVADVLIEMIILHLPSPKQAQKYRASYLYEGPQDDECAMAMQACDPNGPFMMFISKMVPTSDEGRFFAFGRVFSGTAEPSKKVKIMGPNYKLGHKEDVYENTIQKVVLMMGRNVESVASVPCGNICALVGVDSSLVKQGTISDHPNSSIIKSMKYSVAPVVRIAVSPKNPSDLPKLIEGLKKLAKADSLVQVISNENENIIAGCGELHLEICLNDLSKYLKFDIVKSNPIVPYEETVTQKSSQVCMAKSTNKFNKFHMQADILGEELTQAIEKGLFKQQEDPKMIAKELIEVYNWDQNEAKKVWCFGPDESRLNVLVDSTTGVQYLNDVKDSVNTAFNWSTRFGVIAEENLRGAKFNILDVELHRDPTHRGANQIVKPVRRVVHGCQFTAGTRLMEPIYLVEVSCPSNIMGTIYQIFSQRRGQVFQEDAIYGTPIINSKAYLPVSESFGFNEYLRSMTSGKAFTQCYFDHWDLISDDPFNSKSKAFQIMMNIRKRKGLPQEVPKLDEFIDKI